MITQTDLKEIARILRNLKPIDVHPSLIPDIFWQNEQHYRKLQWRQTVESFARMLEQNNPKFKQAVFYTACGYEPEQEAQDEQES